MFVSSISRRKAVVQCTQSSKSIAQRRLFVCNTFKFIAK